MNPQIFREYDIRGVVDKDLTPEGVELLGKAFGSYIQKVKGKEVVVGRDNRLSSLPYSKALIVGITSTGCNVLDVGEVPSPVYYFSLVEYEKDGGIMITASHNPPEFNGFKISAGHMSIYGEEIQKLRKMMEAGEFLKGEGKVSSRDPQDAYRNCFKERIKLKKKIKVVVDAGNGTASELAPSLISELGCEVIPLFCESDGTFPNHHPDPTVPENLKDLIATVKKEKADLGVAYDGDGDRIGVVDEKGGIIWGDKLLIVFAREIIKQHPKAKIIFDVKCSQSLVEEIEKAGGVPIMWKTGHSLIESKIHQEQALLAGEMSGHIYFADNYFGFDDAIFASCRLIEILSQTDKSMSELLGGITPYYSTPELRMDCPEEIKFKVVEKLKKYFKAKYKTIDLDGVRILFGDSWGLVRASNTQAVVVLRFEARSEVRLAEIKKLVMDKLREAMEAES